MCGIWAIINRCKLTPEKLASFEKIKPRGPDHSIIHLNASSIIGFHRLAINDLSSRGEQPFCVFTPDYKYTVIANGEIYNHEELREKYELIIDSRSDCAVILPLFIKLGEDFELLNKQLHGEYAIFITREETKTGVVDYFAATDPLSVRPLFYFYNEHEFGVSSLLAGLSAFSKEVHRLDQGTLVRGRYTPLLNTNELLEVKKYTVQPSVEYFKEDIELYELIV
jgi:asparagine synthase (glutamine-hydrolysing)